GLLATQHFIRRRRGGQLFDRVYVLNPLEHVVFFVERRIAEAKADQEAVELRFGQRERSLVVDRILRGDDEERRLEGVGLAVDRDAAFGHRLQQSRLRARRGPVNLIGEHDLREDRPGAKLELRRLLVEDRYAGDVGGQQVRRALHAFEGAADAASQSPGQHG